MTLIQKLKQIFHKALGKNKSPHELALSGSVGFYIAFSPFPGAHTVMMVIAKWLLKLHFPLLFLTTSVNNPWTMIPFFSFDYAFGYWFVHIILDWHPNWTISLAKIFGSGSICLWSFLIGGNVLGLISALVSYPILKRTFTKMTLNHQ